MIPLVMDPEIFALVVLPILIFLARVADVTMRTIRIIFISRGVKYLAPIIGFFEVLIWIIAVSQIMQNITNVFNYIAYAGGFALGTYIGMCIEAKISIGTLSVRIISKNIAIDLPKSLKKDGYRTTVIDAYGSRGPVKVIYIILKRKKVPELIATVKKIDSKAMYSVEDVRYARDESPPDNISNLNHYLGKEK